MNTTPARLLALAAAAAALPLAGCGKSPAPAAHDWEKSVVQIECRRREFDPRQPWSPRLAGSLKTGVVIEGRRVLTTAEHLSNRVFLRLQRQGGGPWFEAKAAWVDYHANLALLETSDDSFWSGLRPAALAGGVPKPEDAISLMRWREGRLERRRAELRQATVARSQIGAIQHLQILADADIEGAGWGEPLGLDGKLAGLAAASNGKTSHIIPATFIQDVIRERAKPAPRALGAFDFEWRNGENPATLAHLGWTGEPQGVVVTDTRPAPGAKCPFQPLDLILDIDGIPIDIQGRYLDPDNGALSFENLSTRNRWAGDILKFTVWRQGKKVRIDYPLPGATFEDDFVPASRPDQEPEYLIAGGFVFQPLDGDYFGVFGKNWSALAPLELVFQQRQKPTAGRPALVILSTVLPDPFNIGYEDLRFVLVDRINGQPIARISEAADALDRPAKGFHKLEFMHGGAMRRAVLDADALPEATRRVLKNYGIDQDRHIQRPTVLPDLHTAAVD